MITGGNELEVDYSSYFRTLPMAVLEVGTEQMVIFSANRSYREFLKQYIGFNMEEGQQVVMDIGNRSGRKMFTEAVIRCRKKGEWENVREALPNGDTVHAFVRQVAENPVSGKVAVVLIVLAVM